MRQSKTCAFFLKGTCNKGNECKFEHPGSSTGTQMNMQYDNPPRQKQTTMSKSICSYFLKGSCTKPNCP